MTCPAGETRIGVGDQVTVPAGAVGLASFYERQVCSDPVAVAYQSAQIEGSQPEPQGYCESAPGAGDWAQDTGSFVCLLLYSTPDGSASAPMSRADAVESGWMLISALISTAAVLWLKRAV